MYSAFPVISPGQKVVQVWNDMRVVTKASFLGELVLIGTSSKGKCFKYISGIKPLHFPNSACYICVFISRVSHLLNKFEHISNTLEIPSASFSTPPFYLSRLHVSEQDAKTVFF